MKYFRKRIYDTLDLSLLKDPKYVNIILGISFTFAADLSFSAVYPLLLTEFGCDANQITQILTIYYSGDLCCRILLSIVNAFNILKNRYLFLAGSVLTWAFPIGTVKKYDLKKHYSTRLFSSLSL